MSSASAIRRGEILAASSEMRSALVNAGSVLLQGNRVKEVRDKLLKC
jgi:hypothetical protein